MSDDQDDFLSFSAAPIPVPLPKQPKQKSQTKKSTYTSQRKKVSQTSTVYGEDLFQAAWKPTKSIVVCFHPFTKNFIRFSKDEYAGRFAIKHNVHTDGKLILYYFNPPFEWEFDPEADFEIRVPRDNDSVRVYGPYDEIDKIKLKIMSIIRAEIQFKKVLATVAQNKLDAVVQAEEERLENEKEKLTEQLAEAGVLSDSRQFSLDEADSIGKEDSQAKEILVEAIEEKEISDAKVVKDRKGATLKLTPIVY